MGCCFSSPNQNPDDQNGTKNQQPQLRSHAPKSNATHELDRRAPPPLPPLVEEESVKEVLSETPISKHQVPTLVGERKPQMPMQRNCNIQPPSEKFETKGPFNDVEELSEVSQVSEICSMSESLSTTTTATITEKREDEATSKRSSREGTQKWNRSPSNAPRKRPYTVDRNSAGESERRAKSWARRPEPSSEKKSRGGVRSVRERESGQVASWKHNAGSPSRGEVSGRRSRSPSGNVGAGVGRNQLKPSGGAGRRLAKDVGKENMGNEQAGEENQNEGVPQEESLENLHVSLECFIFL